MQLTCSLYSGVANRNSCFVDDEDIRKKYIEERDKVEHGDEDRERPRFVLCCNKETRNAYTVGTVVSICKKALKLFFLKNFCVVGIWYQVRKTYSRPI